MRRAFLFVSHLPTCVFRSGSVEAAYSLAVSNTLPFTPVPRTCGYMCAYARTRACAHISIITLQVRKWDTVSKDVGLSGVSRLILVGQVSQAPQAPKPNWEYSRRTRGTLAAHCGRTGGMAVNRPCCHENQGV